MLGMDVEMLSCSNWEYLKSFFPENWVVMIKELGLLKFGKKFKGDEGASKLIRSLLIHLGGNHSLRTTSTIASEGNIIDVSDVALLKRLKKSSEWFNWMTNELLGKMNSQPVDAGYLQEKYNFRLIDASVIKEPGVTGSNWRLHYSMNLSRLAPDEIIVTNNKTGETFKNFTINKNDVLLGDRVYGTRNSIFHVHDSGGFSIVRFTPHNLPLHDENDKPYKLLTQLRKLKIGQVGEYSVAVIHNGKKIKGRICAIKKDEASAEKARKKVKRQASKKGFKVIKETTLEYAGYVLVFTTLPLETQADTIMEIYRFRWQIELIFKRLKSIIKSAPLYKKDPEGMMGWLNGKVFIATLIEYMICCGESFFPWGYPIKAGE